jgi:NAD(P)-dependent dehydrogenase (short-subunit alcohol dehydrogenase family)
MSEQRTAVVTCNSSGIGFETSVLLANCGFFTYAVVYRLKGDELHQINDTANT